MTSLSEWNAATEGTLSADHDNNGYNNLLDFTLGADPSNPNTLTQPALRPDGPNGELVYEFFLRTDNDIDVIIEESSNLVNWSHATFDVEYTPGPNHTLKCRVTPDSQLNAFYRIRANSAL